MPSRTQRTDEQLRDLSVHVLWHVRQLCRLGAHLEKRGAGLGATELVDPLDAAALEAFLVHARALIEFLWRAPAPADRRPPRADDGLAADFFAAGEWPPLDQPDVLREQSQRIGWGVLHVSYKRVDPEEAWGWDHRRLLLSIQGPLLLFCGAVRSEAVIDGFSAQVGHEFATHLGLATARDAKRFGAVPGSVATPGFAITSWTATDPNERS